MGRTLALGLLVVGAAVALVVGAYSALADSGPASSVAGAVVGAEGSDDVDVLDAVEADDVDGEDVDGQDDVDGDDIDAEDSNGNDGEGEKAIAQVIADEFGASQEDVLALREEGIGFGALFKLHALAAAMEMSVDDLLGTIPTDGDGGYEFGFGKLRNSLTEDQQAALESGPKNLGQLVSASHRPEHAGPPEGVGAADEGHPSKGHGPPDHAPAHGRR